MPGIGDAFLKYLFNYQYSEKCIKRVAVKPSKDDRRGFEELPENTFDREDRKFLAVAVVAGWVVLNASDSDWDEHKALVKQLRVRVRQLCPQYDPKAIRRGR